MEGDDKMQIYKLNFILVMMLILTSKILSSTLAMNVTEVSASDTALIYKWNFNVDGETDNFDLDLLDNIITVQSSGSKSFTFSSGGSDVDIDYSVKMGMKDLMNDINMSKSGEQYVPLVFKVSSEDAVVSDKCSTWFTPEELYDGVNEDAVKIIEDGTFEKSDTGDGITLNIEWWWNTSYYVGTPSDDENYYSKAESSYNQESEEYEIAEAEANAYIDNHPYGEIDDGEGNITVGFTCDCGANHESEHQALIDIAEEEYDDITNHVFRKYVSYDKQAEEYLNDNPVDILFYINGDQALPGVSGD